MDQETLVLHADSIPVFRIGVASLLDQLPNFHYINQELRDGQQALKAILEQQPDIAILAIDLPKLNGVEVAQRLKEKQSATKVVLWGDSGGLSEKKRHWLRLSTLSRAATIKEMKHCLKTMQQGEVYVSPDAKCLERSEKMPISFSQLTLKKLTVREQQIMSLLLKGKSSSEIANHLYVSKRTIDQHRTNIAQKLELKGQRSLRQYVFEKMGK